MYRQRSSTSRHGEAFVTNTDRRSNILCILTDPKKMLDVQVTLRPSTTAATLYKNIDNKGSGSLSGDLDEKEEEETRSLQSRRNEARMKVAEKQVIAERLRKVYMVMQVLQSVGEVLEDVSPRFSSCLAAP